MDATCASLRASPLRFFNYSSASWFRPKQLEAIGRLPRLKPPLFKHLCVGSAPWFPFLGCGEQGATMGERVRKNCASKLDAETASWLLGR